MELKSTEQEVASLQSLYMSLRVRLDETSLPQLVNLPPTTETNDASNNSKQVEDETTQRPVSKIDLLKTVEELIHRFENNVRPKVDRFQKRLTEKDPITNKSKYGENTIKRMQLLLQAIQELQDCLNILQYGDNDNDINDAHQSIIHNLKRGAEQEELEIACKTKADEEEKLKLKKIQDIKEKEEKERQRQEVERERRRQELEDAQRLAALRASLEAERQAHEAASRAEREWIQSIEKGKDGVRKQLQILVESTANDKMAQKTAINALYTLFSQIVAKPEETRFRRIRRDHPQFNEDIGRHAGGKEVLIASGFTLGFVDEVPSFVSREPDVEKDLDGWSDWFDLNKATLELIEEQLINVS